MGQLYLPPGVTRKMMTERQQREAQAREHLQEVTDGFNRDLQRIDPLLSLVFCCEPAPLEVVSAGARPGRFNIMRESANGGPVSFMPIIGPNGEFVEPTSRVFEMLKAADWWDPEVLRERQALENRLEDARRKRQEEERRRMDEEVYERWLAVSRTQVSMNRDTRWAQNSAGLKHLPRADKR